MHIPRATVMTDLKSYLVLQWDRGKSGFYAQVKKKYIPQPDTAGLGRGLTWPEVVRTVKVTN